MQAIYYDQATCLDGQQNRPVSRVTPDLPIFAKWKWPFGIVNTIL